MQTDWLALGQQASAQIAAQMTGNGLTLSHNKTSGRNDEKMAARHKERRERRGREGLCVCVCVGVVVVSDASIKKQSLCQQSPAHCAGDPSTTKICWPSRAHRKKPRARAKTAAIVATPATTQNDRNPGSSESVNESEEPQLSKRTAGSQQRRHPCR